MGNPQLLCLLFFVFVLPLKTFAKNNGTIGVGSTSTAATTKPWVTSPSGDFAFGFKQLQATDQFILCIWYAKLPETTVVWHANTSDAAIPQGSTVRLDSDFGLILSDPKGGKLWTSDGFGDKVAYGVLNDIGNFVLAKNDSTMVWDTFGHPTDTLLPTQVIEIGSLLQSRRSEANFSQGRFYLAMRDDGNLVLFSKILPQNSRVDREYYHSQTTDSANNTNSGLKLIFSSDGSIFILKRSNETKELSESRSTSSSDYYLRLTLDFDGVLSLYRFPKNSRGNQTWTSVWSKPDNICTAIISMYNIGSGACGYNSICSIGTNKRPSCDCPRGYSLIDPGDKYGSCKPDFIPPSCDASSQNLYDVIELPDTDWPFIDGEGLDLTDKEECRMACFNDCLCAAAIYAKSGCWKKRLPMCNGVRDTSIDVIGFLKVGKMLIQGKSF